MSEWWRGNRSFVVLLPAFRSWCCAVRSCSAFLLEYSLRRSHVCDGAPPLALREQQYHQRQKHERRSARCDLETQSARSLARRKDFREASSKNLALHLHTLRSVRGRPCSRLLPRSLVVRRASDTAPPVPPARAAPHISSLLYSVRYQCPLKWCEATKSQRFSRQWWFLSARLCCTTVSLPTALCSPLSSHV